jgi:hypothetical protein
MGKLIFTLISALVVTAFQNCSADGTVYTTTVATTGGAENPNKLEVGNQVYPRSDSTISNPVPLSVSKAALPLALDFSPNPLYTSTGSVSLGYWISSWKQYSIADLAYLGQPEYSYRLDLFKNVVVELTTQTTVYQLSPKEVQTLNAIFSSSILANADQFSANAGCTASTATNYASLETDYGIFDLGAGSPCAVVDLFQNNGSGQLAGLQGFLNQVLTEF